MNKETPESFQEKALRMANTYNVKVSPTMTFGDLAEIIRTQPQSRPGSKIERDWQQAFTLEELVTFQLLWNVTLVTDLSDM